VATVGCTWQNVSAGNTGAAQYTIGIVVNNYYLRDNANDNETINVAQPISGMVTGGGHMVASSSSGQYAAANGLKTNLGFNVKYNKQMTNLQGNLNVIVRAANGKVYQIKTNATSSLTVTQPTATTGVATFLSKANLTDITNPLAPVSLGGNLDLTVTLHDNGQPGSNDTIGITLRNSSGQLLYSSKWSGTNTVEQNLNGGDLVVR
jgi:hypothetical protein